MILHSYWRSGAAYRVRIGLNLKGLDYKILPVQLIKNGGEHNSAAYRAINPQGRVPTLTLDDDVNLVQSPAILEWLEEVYPSPALLPTDALQRARVRGVASMIGCDIHPMGNVGPLKYLRSSFGADDAACAAWVGHWISHGFTGVEGLIDGGDFCFGTSPTLADVYLVPQVFAANRFKVNLDAFPKIKRAASNCASIEAFAKAAPAQQPDAE